MKLNIINPKYVEVEELYVHDPESNMILEAGVADIEVDRYIAIRTQKIQLLITPRL